MGVTPIGNGTAQSVVKLAVSATAPMGSQGEFVGRPDFANVAANFARLSAAQGPAAAAAAVRGEAGRAQYVHPSTRNLIEAVIAGKTYEQFNAGQAAPPAP